MFNSKLLFVLFKCLYLLCQCLDLEFMSTLLSEEGRSPILPIPLSKSKTGLLPKHFLTISIIK